KKRKEEIEVRNTADQAIYTSEKALRDGGDKVPADVKSAVEKKVEAVRGALNGKDTEAIRRATNELFQEAQKIGAAMYGQAGPEAAPGGEGGPQGPGGPSGGEDVVEGEFKEA
ncbi:MAG: Hsp70 family protein, partial [Chloroflexi bacterium]|nr:Hsp70 family protein [Chloroflexota bacterium]